jgi:hypothetical protein
VEFLLLQQIHMKQVSDMSITKTIINNNGGSIIWIVNIYAINSSEPHDIHFLKVHVVRFLSINLTLTAV